MVANYDLRGRPLDNDLVASISLLFDEVHVPSLLWGNYLLTLYGVPTIVDGVGFVVPDALVDVSSAALLRAGFLPCTGSSKCPFANPLRSPPPLHIYISTVSSLCHYTGNLMYFGPSLTLKMHHIPTLRISCLRPTSGFLRQSQAVVVGVSPNATVTSESQAPRGTVKLSYFCLVAITTLFTNFTGWQF